MFTMALMLIKKSLLKCCVGASLKLTQQSTTPTNKTQSRQNVNLQEETSFGFSQPSWSRLGERRNKTTCKMIELPCSRQAVTMAR